MDTRRTTKSRVCLIHAIQGVPLNYLIIYDAIPGRDRRTTENGLGLKGYSEAS
jgi:hypothetical protein